MCHFCELAKNVSHKDWPSNCHSDIVILTDLLEDAHDKQGELAAAESASTALANVESASESVKQKSLPPTPSRRQPAVEGLGARSALPLLAPSTRSETTRTLKTKFSLSMFRTWKTSSAKNPETDSDSNSTQHPTVTGTTDHDWPVTAAQKSQYDEQFNLLDVGHKGYVTYNEASGFFEKSALSRNVLMSIWQLADITGNNRLNMDEFAVACYLIKREWRRIHRGTGRTLLSELPTRLVPPNMRLPHVVMSKHKSANSRADDLIGQDQHQDRQQRLQAQQASSNLPKITVKHSGAKNQLSKARDALMSTLRAIDQRIETTDVHCREWYKEERASVLNHSGFSFCPTGKCILYAKANSAFMCFCNQANALDALPSHNKRTTQPNLTKNVSKEKSPETDDSQVEVGIARAVRIVKGARLVSIPARSPSSVYEGDQKPAVQPDELDSMLKALQQRQGKAPEIINNYGEAMKFQLGEPLQTWIDRVTPLMNLQTRYHACIQQVQAMRSSLGKILQHYTKSKALAGSQPDMQKGPAMGTVSRANPPSAWTDPLLRSSFGTDMPGKSRAPSDAAPKTRNPMENALEVSSMPAASQARFNQASRHHALSSVESFDRSAKLWGPLASATDVGGNDSVASSHAAKHQTEAVTPTDGDEYGDDFGSFLDDFRKGHPFTPTKEVSYRPKTGPSWDSGARSSSLSNVHNAVSGPVNAVKQSDEPIAGTDADQDSGISSPDTNVLRRKKGSESLRSLSSETAGDSDTFMAMMKGNESQQSTPTKSRNRLMRKASKGEVKKVTKENHGV